MKPIRTFAILTVVATLAACGLKGGLDRPPPQFGAARRAYDAEQKAKLDAAEKAKQEKQQRQTITIPTTSTAPPPPTTPVTPPVPPK